jgi:hypothetical protein
VDATSPYNERSNCNRPVFELPCHVVFGFGDDVVEPSVEINRNTQFLYCGQKFFENSVTICTEGAGFIVGQVTVFDCLKYPPAVCILEIDAFKIVLPPLQRIIDSKLSSTFKPLGTSMSPPPRSVGLHEPRRLCTEWIADEVLEPRANARLGSPAPMMPTSRVEFAMI